jgi:hypothetical protein
LPQLATLPYTGAISFAGTLATGALAAGADDPARAAAAGPAAIAATAAIHAMIADPRLILVAISPSFA